jgi:nucleoside-diphosphate-sugar epimerase
MNVLITGANGYIGQRLIQFLLLQHQLCCCVRNKKRLEAEHTYPHIHIVEIDFLNPGSSVLPETIDVAYYLIHSLSSSTKSFQPLCRLPQNSATPV